MFDHRPKFILDPFSRLRDISISAMTLARYGLAVTRNAFITGRPAPSATTLVLFLLSSPK